jgi:streptogramin lyase
MGGAVGGTIDSCRSLDGGIAETDGGAAEAGTVTEFPITRVVNPYDITPGPDCNLWFLERTANNVGRITPSGAITEFPIPTVEAGASGIAAGPDGNLWFAEYDGMKIGRISTAGVITEFPIPDAYAFPTSVTAGPDGRLWFLENTPRPDPDAGAPAPFGGNVVGAMTTSGVFSAYPVVQPAEAAVVQASALPITAGPDGALWFLEAKSTDSAAVRPGCYIGRISTSGQVTDFPLPTGVCTGFGAAPQIISGPGGNLWFTINNTLAQNYVGVVSTTGMITLFALPWNASHNSPFVVTGIAAGPDGNVWLTASVRPTLSSGVEQPELVRMTPTGTIDDVINLPQASALGITAGRDGNIWFTQLDEIGRLTL